MLLAAPRDAAGKAVDHVAVQTVVGEHRGNCRQMLYETTPDCQVILQIDGVYQKIALRDLLPYPCT